ncbi:MAG TPA: mitochondrial fission ELM1 family protein [Brevundimonas sp.]|uniref:mitochondrial fission ELM1 family protein n=1 Tax=Brevundimonas sp. TaxID=1871086 RepID=UPI002E0FF99F|nr:mitochondrial fission ELM1 family protein [Brevundimonas sp.]
MDLTAQTAPLRLRVVTDGRAGIENQALGLAEAIGRLAPAAIDVVRVTWKGAFDLLPAQLKTPAMLAEGQDALGPGCDIWIGCGRASLPLALAARRQPHGPFVVQIQDPRLPPRLFDLVIAPAHDRLEGDNVFEILGAPHRVTAERLATAAPAFADRIEALPRPRIAAMIGGRSKAFDLTQAHATELGRQIAGAVAAAGGSLLLTFSRRTPEPAQAALRAALAETPGWIWDGQGANPLFAFLAAADHVLVTEDSANMATEAASTGKPVHLLPMVARRPSPKFARLSEALEACGAARPFDPALPAWTYAPLDETRRAAAAVLEAFAARG